VVDDHDALSRDPATPLPWRGRATLFDALLPPAVSCFEWREGEPVEALLAEELPLAAGAAAARGREIACGRHCARQALLGAGFDAAPVRRGARREPLFPPGAVGSITHTQGYCAAVVAAAAAYTAIGIDAEPNAALAPRVLERITNEAERRSLAGLESALAGAHVGRLLFAIKESVYKAWYPASGVAPGFRDLELRIDAASGAFAVEFRAGAVPAGGAALRLCRGRWALADGMLLAFAAVMPAAQADPSAAAGAAAG
jgi:4'-phosphopantetheinyl transferase EntD